MMEDYGKKKQSISEQTLQATQWIAADSLIRYQEERLNPVHELYGKTYTAMAKISFIHSVEILKWQG